MPDRVSKGTSVTAGILGDLLKKAGIDTSSLPKQKEEKPKKLKLKKKKHLYFRRV